MISDEILAAFTLPTIPNHCTRDVIERAPWLGESSASPAGWSKRKQREWEAEPTTKHLFYGAFEGDNPTVRTSKENGARLMRAIVADYDCYALSDETLNNHLDDVDPRFSPAYVSRSHSRGIHAIWLLEEPVWCVSEDLRKRLLNWFKKHLRIGSFLPSLDDKAYHDTMLYYEAGTEWQTCDSTLVTTATISRAMLECGEKSNLRGMGVEVPLEIVAEEIDKRFPGRWVGPFEENARGTRFWDDSGDAQSCIVKPNGMLCYTGDKQFMDWQSLFGPAFVEKYITDRLGGACENKYFDGREFWIFAEQTQCWRIAKKDEMERIMRVEHDLDGRLEKPDNSSEIDRALHQVCQTNLVKGARPFVQRKPGLLYLNGQRFLNTASVKACQPAEGECTPDDFPWIENFLENGFVQSKDGHDQLLISFAAEPQEQLFRFLAWLKYAYLAGLEYKPAQGQVLVLAGEPGCGKTLFADVLIAGALGDKKDATSYLMSESRFNGALYDVPCWTVNDAVVASEPGRKARYNALVKRVAANRDFERDEKFEKAGDVAWQGRLVITCNVDPESIQVMPQLDASMADKILALRVLGATEEDVAAVAAMEKRKWFGLWNGRKPDANIMHELPCFLNWLLRWEPPTWIKTNARFGYEAWAHPELKTHAESASYFASFEEVLRTFMNAWFVENESETEWVGTATTLVESMQDETSNVRNSAKSYHGRSVGRDLSNLVARQKCWRAVKDGYTKYHFEANHWA